MLRLVKYLYPGHWGLLQWSRLSYPAGNVILQGAAPQQGYHPWPSVNYKNNLLCMLTFSHSSFPFFSLIPLALFVSQFPYMQNMNALAIYAIAAGGIFVGLFLTQTLSILNNWTSLFSVLVSQHLTLLFVIHRHLLWGLWTQASVILHVSYVVINVFLIFFRMELLTGIGCWAGELALINLIFPLSATHLSYLADLLGITLCTCHRIHHVTGWMAIALLLFHIIIEVQDQQFSFLLSELQNLFTMIVCPITAIICSS